MPTKKETSCKNKGVLVTVYVEKPKKRALSNHHHHHHHHIHHTIKREVIHYRQGGGGKGGGGYISRRAELLQYSQRLRQSTRSAAASTPLFAKQNNTNNQQPHTQIVAVQRKPKNARTTPSCFGNWKVPNIFGIFTCFQAKKERKSRIKKHNGTTSNKIKAVIKSLKVEKKQGFFSKLFSAPPKRK